MYKNRKNYDKIMEKIISEIESKDSEIESKDSEIDFKWDVEFIDCSR